MSATFLAGAFLMRATATFLASAALLASAAFLMGAFALAVTGKEQAVEEMPLGAAFATLLVSAAAALLTGAAFLVSAATEQSAFLANTVAFAALLASMTTTLLLGATMTFLVSAATAFLSCAVVALLARTTAALLGGTVLLSSTTAQIHHALEQFKRAGVGRTGQTEKASRQQRR